MKQTTPSSPTRFLVVIGPMYSALPCQTWKEVEAELGRIAVGSQVALEGGNNVKWSEERDVVRVTNRDYLIAHARALELADDGWYRDVPLEVLRAERSAVRQIEVVTAGSTPARAVPAPTLTASSLRRTLDLAGFAEGQRFELAATRPGRRGLEATWARLTPDGLRRASAWARQRDGRCNLYLGSNPIRDDRQRGRGKRARAADVASMATLLLDVDPVKVKPEDVARGHLRDGPKTPVVAKDLDERGLDPAKLQAADEIALELRAFLQGELGALPPLISSGRGRQIWLRINGDHDRLTRKRLVRALGDRFSRWGLAVIDPPTHDPSRLVRLVGSINLGTGQRAEVLHAGDGQLAAAADVLALVERLDPPKPKRVASPRPQARQRLLSPQDEDERLEDALKAIPADDYETWVSVGMALAASGRPGGYALWDRWSASGSGYEGQVATAAKWGSFSSEGGIGVGTLFHLAIEHGWVPPAPPDPAELDPEDEAAAPPLQIAPPPRAITDPDAAGRLLRSVLTTPKPRGGEGRVVQDRRPTGTGKTTGAATELVAAVAQHGLRFLWASPSHDHGRQEALLALARAGAVIWDEDLDGPDPDRGVRQKLEAEGAIILPVGEPPADPSTPVAGKTAPFFCPGPAVDGWTSDSVEQLYAEAASRDWNPASTVCRACPRFLGDNGDPCAYWERRRLVAEADVLVVPHHSLGKDSGRGRACVVIDEDPSGALIRRVQADRRGSKAFLVLLEQAVERVAASAAQAREELDQIEAEIRARSQTLWNETLPTVDQVLVRVKRARRHAKASVLAEQVLLQAGAVEAVVVAVLDALEDWAVLGEDLLDAYAFPLPAGLEVSQLKKLDQLIKECERALRSLAKRGEKLTDSEGRRVGSPRNLFLFIHQVSKAWDAGRDAVIHTDRSDDLTAIIPTVAPLPPCSILALDATGDPNLLELATGRPVELVEGELVAELSGMHLADVPCGRARWSRKRHRGDTAPTFDPKSKALAADITAIIRYARRVGAERVGLVTFKAAAEHMAGELQQAGLQVRLLHYGGEAGSNAFEGWPDLVVVAGTPYVPPAEIRLRAALQGASVEEILAEPAWEPRRLPSGGTATLLVHGSAPAQQAYQALIAARLEQSLGRAARWDWTPPCGVLVLAEPWPSRHRLTHSTRRAEALDGPTLEVIDLLDGLEDEVSEAIRGRLRSPLSGLPRELVTGRVRSLILTKSKELGGQVALAAHCNISTRSVRRWLECRRVPNVVDIVSMLTPPACLNNRPNLYDKSAIFAGGVRSSFCRPNFRTSLTPTGTNNLSAESRARQKEDRTPKMYVPGGPVLLLSQETPVNGWPDRYEFPPNSTLPRYPQAAPWPDLVIDAIEFAGGMAELGAALGCSRRTVERWKKLEAAPRGAARPRLEAYCAAQLARSRCRPPSRVPPGAPDPNTGEGAPLLGRGRGDTRAGSRSPDTDELCAREVPSAVEPPPYRETWLTAPPPSPDPGEGWRLLGQDEVLLAGDEGWTWADPECTRLGWVPVALANVGEKPKGPGRVPVRRRILHPVPAGTNLPGLGRTYAPARVPASDLPAKLAAQLAPAPPPALTPAEEVARGLEELRALANSPPCGRLAAAPRALPPWLIRAATRSGSSLNRFVSWLARRAQPDGTYAVDEERALERAQDAQLDLQAPLYVRRLWGHVVRLLLQRGARPRGKHAVKVGTGRGALKRARKQADPGWSGQAKASSAKRHAEATQRVARAVRPGPDHAEDVVGVAARELGGTPDARAGPGWKGKG